jgi:hypothetical protein
VPPCGYPGGHPVSPKGGEFSQDIDLNIRISYFYIKIQNQETSFTL